MKKQLETQETYFPPMLEIVELSVEKGFALSVVNYDTGTEQLDVQSEWNNGGEGESFF